MLDAMDGEWGLVPESDENTPPPSWYIQSRERDRSFGAALHEPVWPTGTMDGGFLWEPHPESGRYTRLIDPTDDATEEPPDLRFPSSTAEVEPDLFEHLLRFPSAPSLATNRLKRHQADLPSMPLFHTFRVYTAAPAPYQAKRIFILHNGLNETSGLRFYHRLCRQLVNQHPPGEPPDTVCILRPFPGHLSRFPFRPTFSQQPLDRYLADAGDLFRQFLRFMTETRWLLSALAPRDRYLIATGADLVRPVDAAGVEGSRSDSGALAGEIVCERARLGGETRAARERALKWATHQTTDPTDTTETTEDAIVDSASDIDQEAVEHSVRAIRELIGYVATPAEAELSVDEKPSIHVVGYSLGGFVAQSVFFSWPYLVASCATVLSGGALKDISPTAFADPEEWQTVIHALRYEQDDSMLKQRLLLTRAAGERLGEICGMPENRFELYQRVFYEVFEQQYKMSYQTRAAEFSRRLLFMVGGSDDIVKPQSVLDAAPSKEGINLLEIANLSHFLSEDASGVEAEQRKYWVPEIARILTGFAGQAEFVRANECWKASMPIGFDALDHPSLDKKGNERVLTSSMRLPKPPSDEKQRLPSPLFENFLDAMVAGVMKDAHGKRAGSLFIAQNSMPAVLVGPQWARERATALHHAEAEVANYLGGLHLRRKALLDNAEAVRVVIPRKCHDWHLGRDDRHPSRSETLPGIVPVSVDRAGQWNEVTNDWGRASLRQFDADADRRFDGDEDIDEALIQPTELIRDLDYMRWEITSFPLEVSSLPEIWCWIDDTILAKALKTNVNLLTQEGSADERSKDLVAWVTRGGPKGTPLTHREVATALSEDQLRLVKVSGAAFNPRFRGTEVTKPHKALTYLIHLMLVLSHSKPITLPPG